MNYSNKVFGENLRRIRRAADVTQAELAEMTGIDGSYIARLESGSNTPGFDKVCTLAAVLGCSIDELAGMPAPQDPAKATVGSVA